MRIISLIFCVLLANGCSEYKKVELGNSQHDKSDAKLILIPMQDFHGGAVSRIVKIIEEQHSFKVATYTAMGTSENMYNAERKQYITSAIANNAASILSRHRVKVCKQAIIILTNKDINSGNFNLRYVFSSHYNRACLSVISTARINPVNYNMPRDDELVEDRLMKLINKSIGLNYYRYKVSSSRESVMYGPILGPMDLDAIGSWY